ncbi:MAG: CoB--CoM heterodisulfide reductase iron-sulfur subunit A family protein [Archaeoglobus sp.]|uniref:CoB--CoM heterodisulfide reductase iron-sulfur subunit A family protein n=1 Tax=Archaeoglobus sp. TaxID=1872626 RepID=UPI001D46C78D|nr:CoB--CoM heterodisulfide reductase iron-sulfur subunit A family protein [Archaeoglobus sp.]MBO8178953.1 CoB--CoM heterodisulfide reductase iron-sulfur subunit A family protein [Archaeoglobus sp.]
MPVGAVLVIGGGIAGIQSALDLAESGFKVYLLEKLPAIGGRMSQLDKTFPTNDCSMCILSPKLNEVGRHENIEIINNAELVGVEGEAGDFKVKIKKKPLYVDPVKCTGCGACSEACPVSAIDEYNEGLSYRSAIFLRYPQAVPKVYSIDKSKCIGCGICQNVCVAKAIDYNQKEEEITINVGTIILTPGGKLADAVKREEYGYGVFPNVITSIQFERLLSATGPFEGHVARPSDGKEPKKIGIIQCVCSRDAKTNEYCSSVCCTYATKHAIIAKEHIPDAEIHIFIMDLRTFGKGFEEYAKRAEEEYGVKYHRGRVSVVMQKKNGNLLLKYEKDGRSHEEEFDLVVLSVGFEPPEDMKRYAENLGINLNEYGFVETDSFNPISTSKPGIYVAGVASEPKDIPESVAQASSAAAKASSIIASERGKLITKKEYPPERDVTGEPPRIGVFVCHCGINIASVVDVERVAEFAKTLDDVVFADHLLFTCSADSQERIKQAIRDYNLNRIVVAACTPRTHEQLFRNTLREAGLNPYLFEFVNIREHCSWVHTDKERATKKAMELVAAGVAKARDLEPLQYIEVDVTKKALVIGGGLAGMTAALELANQGVETFLVEKEEKLGGNLQHIYYTIDGKDPQELLRELVEKVESNPLIKVYKNARVESIEGFVGNYTSRIVTEKSVEEVQHGVVIVATGAKEYKPKEYLYGEHPRVVTQVEFEHMLINKDVPNDVIMIQCVGSRNEERPYCSRICCQTAIKNALKLKELNPDANVMILYRDIRTYGFLEKYYKEAAEKGVVFVRYDPDNPPKVRVEDGRLVVEFYDEILEDTIIAEPEYVVLSAATVPNDENEEISKLLKVPLDANGFFLEAHPKLRPVDFATEGVFLAGIAHSPRLIPETISLAYAAVSRALTVLTKDKIIMEATKAEVVRERCDACGMCVKACPVNAIEITEYETRAGVERKAAVNKAVCLGCGVCSATCPKAAIVVKGFTFNQIKDMVDALEEVDAILAR